MFEQIIKQVTKTNLFYSVFCFFLLELCYDELTFNITFTIYYVLIPNLHVTFMIH